VIGGATLSLISACAGGLYLKLAGNLAVEKLAVLGARPQSANSAQNILLLGSQTRDGQIGTAFGGRDKLGSDISDTAMLVHLSGDRRSAVVTSIPRDLIVPRPDCVSRTDPHRTIPGSTADMFDLAMNLGGPSCAVATVEHMTNLRVDHFIRVDFNGFRDMVNALGGVDVCVPAPGIHDWRSGLNLPPGHHVVRDQEALAFVRDRHGIGDGGDLGRIRMQQVFMASLAQKIQGAGTLTSPITLYKLADAATSALTVDPGLGSIRKLVGLARELRGLTTNHITFITAPSAPDSLNRNRLLPAQPGFDELFRAMAADRHLGATQLASFSHPTPPDPAAEAGLRPVNRVIPGAEAVTVEVLNATHRRGSAARVASQLRDAGFHVTGIHRTTPGSPTTIGGGDEAQVLASALAGPVAVVPEAGPQVTLTVGEDFPGLRPVAAAAATRPQSTGGAQAPSAAAAAPAAAPAGAARSADADICSGLPRPRTDAAVDPKRSVGTGHGPVAPPAPGPAADPPATRAAWSAREATAAGPAAG